MEIISWLKSLPQEKQELFFKKAARFFSNRELTAIVADLQAGCSLLRAHVNSGVLERYVVDLNNLKQTF